MEGLKFSISRILIFFFFGIINFSLNAQIDYSKFNGAKAKANIVKEFPFANVYDYNFNSPDKDSLLVRQLKTNTAESALSTKFANEFSLNTKDSISFSVKLVSRMIVDLNNKKHYFISYKKSNSTSKEVIDFYVDENSKFITNVIASKEVDLFKSILKNSNAFMLFKFYSNSNNKKYSEINALKSQVKNEQDVLDIKKLDKVLKENKASLSKYLE